MELFTEQSPYIAQWVFFTRESLYACIILHVESITRGYGLVLLIKQVNFLIRLICTNLLTASVSVGNDTKLASIWLPCFGAIDCWGNSVRQRSFRAAVRWLMSWNAAWGVENRLWLAHASPSPSDSVMRRAWVIFPSVVLPDHRPSAHIYTEKGRARAAPHGQNNVWLNDVEDIKHILMSY